MDDKTNMFYRNLPVVRKMMGMTQSQAAKKMKINENTYGAYERHEVSIPLIKANIIAGAFLTTVSEMCQQDATAKGVMIMIGVLLSDPDATINGRPVDRATASAILILLKGWITDV